MGFKIKGWISIFVVLILVITPLVFAHENSYKGDCTLAPGVLDTEASRNDYKERCLGEISDEDNVKQTEKRLDDYNKNLRNSILTIQKSNFKNYKKELKECKRNNGPLTQNCKILRKTVKTESKDYMIELLKKAYDLLDKTILKADSLNLEDKESFLVKLNEDKESIKTLIVSVEALNEESTNEEIKQLSLDVKITLNEIKLGIRNFVVFSHSNKFVNLFEKFNKQGVDLNEKLEKLKDIGVDTSELDIKKENYDKLVDEANKIFQEARITEDRKLAIQKFEDVHLKLKEANSLAREISIDLHSIKNKEDGEKDKQV